MKKTILSLLAMACMSWMSLSAHDCLVIPQPASFVAAADSISLPATVTLTASGEAKKVAKLLESQLTNRGIKSKQASGGFVAFKSDSSLGAEQYLLSVTHGGVVIKASTGRGFFYGAQTLLQLISNAVADGRSVLQLTEIADSPRFGYRGVMLDVVRYFIPKDEILKVIDVASQLKINTLHLHLCDDNGWRLQIKKYPKLTSVGAWRVQREECFPGRLNPKEGEPTPVGGFYTQKEIKEIVKYASDHYMDVVPEIEMPAHAVAAIASYPELTCPTMGGRFIGVLPGIGGKDASIILCAGNDKVFTFIENVLDEVMALFPSKYIHLGGDEAEKSHWKACPLCQKRMKDNGIENEEMLQGYFMDRVIKYLESKGRKAMGWEEIINGQPKEDVVVFGWLGEGNGVVKDARATGRKFVMTPAKKFYLIRYQGPQWFEPVTYFGNNTLSDVYGFEPVKDDWTPQLESQLQGIQASLWTEFCNSNADVEYLLYPRLMALADNAWRQKGSGDINNFLASLDAFIPYVEKEGNVVAKSMYNIQHTVAVNHGKTEVKLECVRPDVEIRYTVDGTQPTATSSLYGGNPISLDCEKPYVVKAATFQNGGMKGKELCLNIQRNSLSPVSVKSSSCNNGLAYTLINGLRGSDKHSDFEWAGWYDRDAEFEVDLGENKEVHGISLGVIANGIMSACLPKAVFVYGKAGEEAYKLLGQVTMNDDEVFKQTLEKTDISLDFNANVRFLKVTAVAPGRQPVEAARSAQTPWMYFDEIIVR